MHGIGFAALLLGLALLPGARAETCWFDDFGREHCDGVSTGVRVGIAIAIAVAAILAIISLFFWRRRRVQQANLAYINNQQSYPPGPAPAQPYGQGYAPDYQGGYGGSGYPPQPAPYGSPAPGTPYGGYNGDFAPPTGPPPAHMGDQPPPQYYAPPEGAPPQGKM